MNRILIQAGFAATVALSPFQLQAQAQAQAQALDKVSAEVFGVALPLTPVPARAMAPVQGLSRAEVVRELERARAAGELDFAAAEVGFARPAVGQVHAGDLPVGQRAAR